MVRDPGRLLWIVPAGAHAPTAGRISHRYGAAALSLAIVALVAVAWLKRREPGRGREACCARHCSPSCSSSRSVFGAVTVNGASSVGGSHPPRHRDVLLAVLVAAVVRLEGLALCRRRALRRILRLKSGGASPFLPWCSAHSPPTRRAPLSCEGFPLCHGPCTRPRRSCPCQSLPRVSLTGTTRDSRNPPIIAFCCLVTSSSAIGVREAGRAAPVAWRPGCSGHRHATDRRGGRVSRCTCPHR